LLALARHWLYEHHYLIPGERHLLDLCRSVLSDQEAKLVRAIEKSIPLRQREAWVAALSRAHTSLPGQRCLDWLKQSPRSRRGQGLAGAFERIFFLSDLKVATIVLPAMPLELVKAYANRIARLKLTRFARLKPAMQTIGLTSFLQVALWRTTDEAIEAWLMRVSEVRQLAMERVARFDDREWPQRHASLLGRVKALTEEANLVTLQTRLAQIVSDEEGLVKQTRADRARSKLAEMSPQVRSLMRLIVRLPIRMRADDSWLKQAIPILRTVYRSPMPVLAASTSLNFLPKLWRPKECETHAVERLRMLESATLLQLQRSLRVGSAIVHSSLSFREYEDLQIPRSTWNERRSAHLQLLDFPGWPVESVKRLQAKMLTAMDGLSRAVGKGFVTISEQRGIELETTSRQINPDQASLEERVHQAFASRFGLIELPRLMMEVDAQIRFSTVLLRRTPTTKLEVMAIYGALLAQGMGLDRVQVARMMPGVPESQLRVMMQLLQEDGRLSEASSAVMQFMRRHPIVSHWGESGLASADMMTVESSRRLWNSRVDPGTGNYAIGTYTHVLD
jgi:hypothetical protein